MEFEIIKKGIGYEILMYLHDTKNKNVYGSVLMQNIKSNDANIASWIKILHKRGLIEKESKRSKLIKYLSLTQNGRQLVKLLKQVDLILNKKQEKGVKIKEEGVVTFTIL